MYHPWFFGRRRGCCCQQSCCQNSRNSSDSYSVAYYRHFANVPMRVYYGSGFTAEDSLESIDNSLETIAAHFSQQQNNHCCNCG